MFKKTTTWLFFFILIGLFSANYLFEATVLEARWTEQTIPTRTPVPAPTSSSGGSSGSSGSSGNSGGNSGGNAPAPTSTAIPATATATSVPVTLAATIDSGTIYIPSTCGQVTFESNQGSANVRSGPSQDFRTISQLVFLEVRPVIGRSATAEWWYIELPSGGLGWVADIAGNITGNITTVPIVDESGNIITDTPTWNPTPNPDCPTAVPTATTIPPTATPILPTNTPTNTPVADTSGQETTDETVDQEETTQVVVTETATAEPSLTPAPPTATPTPSPTAETVAEVENIDISDSDQNGEENVEEAEAESNEETNPIEIVNTTANQEETPTESGGINWFIISGIILIGLGGGAYVFQRFQTGTIGSE